MAVVVGVLTETAAKETRVAVVPEIAAKLKTAGVRVLIERGAGKQLTSPMLYIRTPNSAMRPPFLHPPTSC
jgi:hypothetical protein